MSRALRLQVFVLTLTRIVFNTTIRMVYPFLPALGRGLGVSLTDLSRVLTWRSLAGAFGPFLASVADSRGRKAGILIGLLIFIAGAGSVLFWPTFTGFVIALLLTAVGKYVFDPSLQAYLGDRIPYARRGFTLALTELAWSGSFILAVPLMGFLIASGGWTAAFPPLLGISVLALVVLYFLMPKDPPPAAERPKFFRNLGTVFSSSAALAGLAVTLLVATANEVVNLIFGVWLEDSFGVQIAALGAASAVIGFAELAGEGLVGTLADRLGLRRAVALGIVFCNLTALALPYIGLSLPGAVVGLFLFYIAFEFTFVSIIPLMTEVLPKARATLMAVNITAATLGRGLGAWVGPLLYARGFTTSALASIVLNFIALVALRGVRLGGEDG